MANFFHRFFNPHCPECQLEKHCNSCDELRSLLNIEKREKQQLLDRILQPAEPKREEPIELKPEDIVRNSMSWRVRQQLLEQEDRAKAATLRKQKEEQEQLDMKKKSTEDIEKELGLTPAGN